MLIIKKTSQLSRITTNYRVLKPIKDSVNLRKSNSHTVFLRAPKNFNIGKLKVKNFNYKHYKLSTPSNILINNNFFFKNKLFFKFFNVNISSNNLMPINSIQISVKTTAIFGL